MGRTFRDLYAEIDPRRRARIVLEMDAMHRRYLETVGGQASIIFDVSEYLTDEMTIDAYLAEVQALNDPTRYLLARADAVRARERLVSERIQSKTRSSVKQERAHWVEEKLLGRRYVGPRFKYGSRPGANAPQSTTTPRPLPEAGDEGSQSGPG